MLCLRRFVKKSPRWLLSICVDFVTRKDTCISKRRENVSCKNIYLGSFQTTDPWNSTSKDLCQCANPLGQGSNNPLLSQWQLFSVHRTHVRSMAARSFQCAQGDSCFKMGFGYIHLNDVKILSSCVVIPTNCQRNKLFWFFLNSIIKTKRICYKKIYTEERDMLYLWCYFYI